MAEGVFSARIAAHSGDIVKGVKGAAEWDRQMSEARKALDWGKMYELALSPARAKSMRMKSENLDRDVCTMCGEMCSVKRDNVSKKPKK